MKNTSDNKICRIAVDAMGGDYAPENPVLGAIKSLEDAKDIDITLLGDKAKITSVLKENKISFPEEKIIHASEIIDMSDSPVTQVRTKKNSSMVLGAQMVKKGEADAFISAGNTGAMMAASTLLIGRVKGVGRPTIGTPLPTEKGGSCFMFDAGASVDCKPIHLLEYALLATIYLEEIYKIKNPTVGLLSVGEEETKGNELTFAAYKLLKDSNVNFVGNVEGRDILKGTVDIVVCDGFMGNVLLKFAESMMGLLKAKLRNYADKSILNKLGVLAAKGTLKAALSDMDYQKTGGVPLLGIDGISIIGHGSGSVDAIKNMIMQGREMYFNNLIQKFKQKLEAYEQSK